eukprot:6174558-Pleurochrysis_carterae.AAC.4
MGTPRSSNCRSPGGGRTKTAPSSPSNSPCRFAASTSNLRTRRPVRQARAQPQQFERRGSCGRCERLQVG